MSGERLDAEPLQGDLDDSIRTTISLRGSYLGLCGLIFSDVRLTRALALGRTTILLNVTAPEPESSVLTVGSGAGGLDSVQP